MSCQLVGLFVSVCLLAFFIIKYSTPQDNRLCTNFIKNEAKTEHIKSFLTEKCLQYPSLFRSFTHFFRLLKLATPVLWSIIFCHTVAQVFDTSIKQAMTSHISIFPTHSSPLSIDPCWRSLKRSISQLTLTKHGFHPECVKYLFVKNQLTRL